MFGDDKRPVRLADVLVASISITLLSMLLAPSLADSTSDARRNACLNNVKHICLGLNNHESARLYYPGASTAPITGKPGSADDSDNRAGFSWLALTLPYMERPEVYNAMRDGSEKMTISPFADSVRIGKGDAGAMVAAKQIEEFICPAFEGAPTVNVGASDYKIDATSGASPAKTNYFASSGTHLFERDGGWFLDAKPETSLQGNGALPMFSEKILANGGWTKVKGTTHAGLSRDGTSNTIMFCEGREQAYSAWIDGQVAWTVAAWPMNPDLPAMLKDETRPDAPPTLGWTEDQLDANAVCIAKQPFGADDKTKAEVYLPADRWSGSKDRRFGRSGNHQGMVCHAFADAHCKMIDELIDQNVYLHLTTRNGMEVIPDNVR